MTYEESTPIDRRRAGTVLGSMVADSLAMPVHWYYDRAKLHRDYGEIRDYLAPRNPHADSILWRSSYKALNEKGEILHDQAQYWGQRGIHYHQFLEAGETIAEHATEYFALKRSRNWSTLPDHEVVGNILSSACYIHDAFPASLHLAWKYAADFERGVVVNANLGGDSCHRGAVIGALLGAANGAHAIPDRFLSGLKNASHLADLLQQAPATPAKAGHLSASRNQALHDTARQS